MTQTIRGYAGDRHGYNARMPQGRFVPASFFVLALLSLAAFSPVLAQTTPTGASTKPAIDPANLQCPTPKINEIYRSDMPPMKSFFDPVQGKYFYNLYGEECKDKAKSGVGLTAIGICVKVHECKATKYVGLDGKQYDLGQGQQIVAQSSLSPGAPSSVSGTSAPWQPLLPQLTAQQINSAFESGAGQSAVSPSGLNPKSGQLETLGGFVDQSGMSLNSGDTSQTVQSANYSGPSAATVADLAIPGSPVNEALNSMPSTPNPVLSAQSGFGSASPEPSDATPTDTGSSWWQRAAHEACNFFTLGFGCSSAQAGSEGKTDAQVIAEAKAASGVSTQSPDTAAGSVSPAGVPVIPVASAPLSAPTTPSSGGFQPSESDIRAQIAKSIPLSQYDTMTPASQQTARSIAEQSLQLSQPAVPSSGKTADILVAKVAPDQNIQTAPDASVRPADAPSTVPVPVIAESAKPIDQRNADTQAKQLVSALAAQCPAADSACAQRASNLLQTLAGGSVQNCPECAAYADVIKSGYNAENGIGRIPILNDPNVSAPTSVLSAADTVMNSATARRADLEVAVADYVKNGPSSGVQQIIANADQGVLSKAFSVIAEKGTEASAIARSQMPAENITAGDYVKTAGWGIAGFTASALGTGFSAVNQLAGISGVPGFTPDLTTQLKQTIDPTGAAVETTANIAVLAPLAGGALNKIAGGAGDLIWSGAESGIVRNTEVFAGIPFGGAKVAKLETEVVAEAPSVSILPSQATGATKEALRFEPDVSGLNLPRAANISPVVPDAAAVVTPAAENTARISGALSDVSAGSNPALDQSVRDQVRGGWPVAAGIVGIGTCALFDCYQPEAQQKILQTTVTPDVVTVDAATMERLFPSPIQAPATPVNDVPPAAAPEHISAQPSAPVEAAQTPDTQPSSAPAPSPNPPAETTEPPKTVSPAPVPDPLPTPAVLPSESGASELKKQLAIQEADRVRAERELAQAEYDAQVQAENNARQQQNQMYADAIAKKQAQIDADLAALKAADDAQKQSSINVTTAPAPTPGPSATDIFSGLSPNSVSGAGSGSGAEISLNNIQFKNDQALLVNPADAQPLGQAMKDLSDKGYTFNIQGNTDPNTPSARWQNDNMVLGLARAETLRQTISSMYGIPLQNITITSAGSQNLIYDGSGNVDYAASRRVVVTAIPPR